jgi:hypothetical protein
MVQKPEMARVLAVKAMEAAQTSEESSPSASKLGAHFDPEPLDAGVSH